MHNKPLAVETSHHSSSSVTVSIFGALSEILSHTTESLSFLTSTTTESSPLAHTHSTFLSTDPSHSKKPISSTIQSAPKKVSSIINRTTNPNTFDPFSSIEFASSEANEATVSRTTAADAATSSPPIHRHREDDVEQVQEFISETSTKSFGQSHLSSTNNDTHVDSSQLSDEQIDQSNGTNHSREKSARLLQQMEPIESTTPHNPIQSSTSISPETTTSISFVETSTATIPFTSTPETITELMSTTQSMNLSPENVSHATNRSIDDSLDILGKFRVDDEPHIIISNRTAKQNETTNTSNITSVITTPLNAPITIIAQTTTPTSETSSIPTTMPTTILDTTADITLTTEIRKVSMPTTKTETTATMTTVSAKFIPKMNPTFPKNVEMTTTQPPSVNIFDLMSKRVTALAEPFAVTEPIRPIYMRNDFVATTQSTGDATQPATTIHTPRFLNRIPILPIGFYGATTRAKLPPLLHSSITTPKMHPVIRATLSAPPSRKSHRFDFVVYGILPNKTVIRKYPDDLFGGNDDATTEDRAIVYGILSNRTVIRKFPNGTVQIDEKKSKSRAFEVTDIDVKSLFNPNSDIYVKQWSTENGVAAALVHSLASTVAAAVAHSNGRRDGSQKHPVIVNTNTTSTAPPDTSNIIDSNNSPDLLMYGNRGRDSTKQATINTNNNSTTYYTATNSTTTTTNSATTNTIIITTSSPTSLVSTYHNVNITSDSAMVFNLPHTIYSISTIYLFIPYVFKSLS